jgi:ABC-type phosphate transport system substrate-binding protein
MKNILTLIVIIAFVALGSLQAQSYKVIVNSSNETSSISKKDASDFFLKKKTKWANGNSVSPVDLSSNSNVRDAFSQQVHGKNTAAIRNFWQQAAFSGSATTPPEKATDDDVIEYVKKNPGAIGYVSHSANTAGVKTITIN